MIIEMVNFSLSSFTCFIYLSCVLCYLCCFFFFFFFLPSWGLNNYHDCILFSSLTQLQEEINRETNSGRCEYTIFFSKTNQEYTRKVSPINEIFINIYPNNRKYSFFPGACEKLTKYHALVKEITQSHQQAL